MASDHSSHAFQVGQVLNLTVLPEHSQQPSIIRVQIQQLHYPRTLSCCMIVDILDEGYPKNPVFLKLFDRRFSEQLRKDHGIDPWTVDIEKEYISIIQTGAVHQFLHKLHTIPTLEQDTGETWDAGENEAFLADLLQKLFDAESSAYSALHDIQGKMVPSIIARVRLALPSSNIGMDAHNLLHTNGILLQYIQGFSLSNMKDKAPKSDWQGIVDKALATVQTVGDHGILNRDVRPDNFIVKPDGDGAYQVFMIDFGLARLRGENESDRDWALAKLEKDEEGAVGLVMKKRLSREGFDLHYQESDRYMGFIGTPSEE